MYQERSKSGGGTSSRDSAELGYLLCDGPRLAPDARVQDAGN